MEIEIKVKVENVSPLLAFLNKEGHLKYERRQTDEYFVPQHRDFAARQPIAEWLRIRTSDGSSSINYKRWLYEADGRANEAIEFETEVTDVGRMRDILLALDFSPLITVDKRRKSWRYNSYEISLDQVSDLGEFVEIELIGNSTESAAVVTDRMLSFLDEVGCGRLERDFKGYPYMLLDRRRGAI